MQWTVPQIQAELAHLDVQILSYIERCQMGTGCEYRKLKILHKWFKAQTALMVELLAEIGMNYPGMHENVKEEQASEGIDEDEGFKGPHHRYRPSRN